MTRAGSEAFELPDTLCERPHAVAFHPDPRFETAGQLHEFVEGMDVDAGGIVEDDVANRTVLAR
jgi:hypothetical protein